MAATFGSNGNAIFFGTCYGSGDLGDLGRNSDSDGLILKSGIEGGSMLFPFWSAFCCNGYTGIRKARSKCIMARCIRINQPSLSGEASNELKGETCHLCKVELPR